MRTRARVLSNFLALALITLGVGVLARADGEEASPAVSKKDIEN